MSQPKVEVLAGINLTDADQARQNPRRLCPLQDAVAAAQEAGRKYVHHRQPGAHRKMSGTRVSATKRPSCARWRSSTRRVCTPAPPRNSCRRPNNLTPHVTVTRGHETVGGTSIMGLDDARAAGPGIDHHHQGHRQGRCRSGRDAIAQAGGRRILAKKTDVRPICRPLIGRPQLSNKDFLIALADELHFRCAPLCKIISQSPTRAPSWSFTAEKHGRKCQKWTFQVALNYIKNSLYVIAAPAAGLL